MIFLNIINFKFILKIYYSHKNNCNGGRIEYNQSFFDFLYGIEAREFGKLICFTEF